MYISSKCETLSLEKIRKILICFLICFVSYSTQKLFRPVLHSSINTEMYSKLFEYLSKKTAYFLACKGNASVHFMISIKRYEELNKNKSFPMDFQYSTSYIDLRDGMPKGILDSDIVVTTEKMRMCEQNQHVISYPFEQFQKGSGIAKAFELLDTLDLGGETVYIYEKNRELTDIEIKEFYNYFNELYPDNPLFPKFPVTNP